LGIDFKTSGIPSEEEYVAAYCKRTGREIEDWNFYLAFSMFRLASIGQGVLKRNLDGIGTADATEIDMSGKNFLADTAWAILNRG
jgi:aminoglycoside phosphotransferase (APT) family kinase protein